MPVHNTNIANVSPGHYDYGLGYGVSQNKFHKPRNRGDIYSPKSEWDLKIHKEELYNKQNYILKSVVEDCLINFCKKFGINLEKKYINKKNNSAKFQTKAFSAHFQNANDSMPHYDKFTNVGAAGAGHTTINAGYDRNKNIEYLLREHIRNIIIEMGPSVSVVNGAKNTGSGNKRPYSRKNTLGSGMNKSSSMGSQVRRSKNTWNSDDGVKGYKFKIICDDCGEKEEKCLCNIFNFSKDYKTPGTEDFKIYNDANSLQFHKSTKNRI
tara:strand:- start:716 stop:1516 length:801 start_codon:yes stop_codon:yes gene_type:complete